MSPIDMLRAGVRTRKPEETEAWGRALGRVLPTDTVLALGGDLGTGKTTFVRGLAVAWNIGANITSPTFNIFTLYRGDRNLLHLDAYRLEGEDALDALMLEEYMDPPWCLAVEWPGRIRTPWLEEAWWVRLEIERVDPPVHAIRLETPTIST